MLAKYFQSKFTRGICFILIWLSLSLVINFCSKPNFNKTINAEIFNICAEKINKNDHEPPLPLYSLIDYHANPQNFRLCQAPYQQAIASGIFRLRFEQKKDGSFVLMTWNDSMGDPLEYHYRVVNTSPTHVIEPIGWRHGTAMALGLSYFFGLIISTLIYKIIKRKMTTQK